MVEGPSGIYVKLAISFLLGLTFFIVQTKSEDDRLVNYITTAELPDGEHEIRMRFGDVIVRETSVTERNEKGIRRGLMLRQIASGPHLLQLIHKLNEAKTGNKKDHLIECEVMNDWGAANQFRTHFQKELTRSGLTLQVPTNHKDISEEDDTSFDFDSEHTESQTADTIDLDQGMDDFRNVTVRMLRNDEVIGDLQRSFDIILQQKQCKRLHRRMKRAAKEKSEAESESINGDNKDHSSRFRSCLKQTNTGAANFVGKLFFNVVQTKCFVLKPERSCVKQSWWGKCLKYEYKKQAYLREPLPY